MIPSGPGRRLRAITGRYRGFEPDARRFLIVTLVGGAATSLWWIDVNLYLASLGYDASLIGIIATAGSLAGVLVALPVSALSDRIGRRRVMAVGSVAGAVAVAGLVVAAGPTPILLLVTLYGAGSMAMQVTAVPYLSEHSEPGHRSELFALQFAVGTATNLVAAALGGVVAGVIAGRLGFAEDGPDTYRIILGFMVALHLATLVFVLRLGDDRPSVRRRRRLLALGEPAAFPPGLPVGAVPTRWAVARLGLTVRDRRTFVRLLVPGLLISIGAGQIIPFLNLFIQAKFGLDLAALNGVFAVTSIGTMLAILFQPTLARRFGRLRSVILVQGASIPFLFVLGFSPVLPMVVAAMTVRNSLMNAGNPIFSAFAMDQVSPAERATLSAAMQLTWSGGWVVGGVTYSAVHATLGFDAGYAVNFVTVIVLYTVATWLYWHWLRDAEPVGAATGSQPAMAATTD